MDNAQRDLVVEFARKMYWEGPEYFFEHYVGLEELHALPDPLKIEALNCFEVMQSAEYEEWEEFELDITGVEQSLVELGIDPEEFES